MIGSAITMRTKANLVLYLFMLILLSPASSSISQTSSQSSVTPTEASNSTQNISTSPEHTEKYKTTSTIRETSQTPTSTYQPTTSAKTKINPATTTKPTAKPSTMWLVPVLLVIIVVMLCVGCIHCMCKQDDSSMPRFLVDMRERLRSWTRILEDRLGVRLWPERKRGVEDDIEETDERQAEEGGQWKDGRGERGSSEVTKNEEGEHKDEDSDTSDDYSSMEGDDLREKALNRHKEDERNQTKDKEENEMSSSSDEDQSAAEEENSGNKRGGSEEIALVNSPQEDEERADLCDVTAL